MTQIFIVCAIASTIMFFLFFVLPGIDRVAARKSQSRQSTGQALPQRNKAVRANA